MFTKNKLFSFLSQIKPGLFFSKKFFKIFFWILLWFCIIIIFWFFYLNWNKNENIEVSWKWYNLSQQKYINSDNPEFNNWDLIKRTILFKNKWFFDVENFFVKDHNPFTNSDVEFLVDIKAWEVSQKTYKVLASKIWNFKEELKTKDKEIVLKEFKPVIWKKKVSKPFWSFSWISKDVINNDFDEYFEVYWKWLKSIDNIFINCWKKSETFDIAIPWDEKVAIQINHWSLWSWSCAVWTFFNWISFFSDLTLKSLKTNNLLWVSVKNIVPREVFSKKWWTLVFQWSWFEKVVAAQIDDWTILDLNFLKVVNDNVLIINLPKKIKKWEYFFRLLTKKWVLELKNLKIKIK